MQDPKRVLLVMGNTYLSRVHAGVAEIAGKNHWHLVNLYGYNPSWVEEQECDGILAALHKGDELSDAVIEKGKPTVCFSSDLHPLDILHVTGDNMSMGSSAAKHYLERGFQKFIWYSENQKDMTLSKLRWQGYREELTKQGYTCHDIHLLDDFPSVNIGWTEYLDWIRERIDQVGLPCAVYAFNDHHAIHFMEACLALDIKIPEEVAIMGTGNDPILCPNSIVPLSSINHDLNEMGRRAALELKEIFEGKTPTKQILNVPHKGVATRQSTDVFAVNDPAVLKALHVMYAHFREPLDVDQIAKKVGMNRRTLERRFQSHLRSSIQTKLNDIRLEHACSLLRDTDLAIADIAAQTGFRGPEYFHRCFKQARDLTPRQYRLASR